MHILRTDPSHTGSSLRLVLSGELDVAGAVLAREAVDEVMAPGLVVELDLGGVTFMDSAGARFLIWAGRSAQTSGGGVVVTAMSGPAQRLLTLARADESVRSACTWTLAS